MYVIFVKDICIYSNIFMSSNE